MVFTTACAAFAITRVKLPVTTENVTVVLVVVVDVAVVASTVVVLDIMAVSVVGTYVG